MQTKIILKDVRLYAYHGALPQEHVVGTAYLLNLVIDTDFTSAMHTDRIAGTINYADIYEVVKQEMQTPSQLVEHVGGRICKALFQHFPSIQSLQLELLKENPPIAGCQCAGMGVSLNVKR